MKIVIFTSSTPANVWLVNQILSQHDAVGIVIERAPLALHQAEKAERRRRMIERYGLVRSINKLAYNWYRSRFLADADDSIVKEHFFPGDTAVRYSRELPSVSVGNINDAACMKFVQQLAPDAIAVCGTSVIKPEVFSLAPKGAINIHTGIIPEYRCADPIFWALYRGEPEKVGVTIHFIDRGIDTGPIIHQGSVPIYSDDTLNTVYQRCIRFGAKLYKRALSELEDGSIRTVNRTGVEAKSYYSVDLGIVQYFRFRCRFRKMARHLPRSNEIDIR